MTREMLLNDQRYLFRDLPTEPIVIGVQSFNCICLGAVERNRWEEGGLLDQPVATVAIERRYIQTMPKQGAQVAFRGAALSVGSVAHDHDTSPVRIELESLAGRK